MEHSEAVRTRIVERYLLNELESGERSAFEEHYFTCQDCAEEVRIGTTLMENLHEAVRNAPVASAAVPARARRSFQFSWLAPAFAAAAVVLLAVVGYQALVVIPRLRREVSVVAPQALTSVSLMSSVSRGGSLPLVKVGPNEPFGLYLDIPPQPGIRAFQCKVLSDSKIEFIVRIPEKQASDTVHLLVPGGKLAAGHYDLVVSGVSGEASSDVGPEVVRYSFQVEN